VTTSLGDGARALLDGVNLAVLTTLNNDGSPQSSVVWVGRDGDDVLVSSAAGRRKERNLRRDPRVSLCVLDAADPDRYVEVRGSARVTEDVGRRIAIALAEKYDGPEGGDEYRDLPEEHVRVAIRITPERLTGPAA
jgi:PPOX class probable F420-dependent enzyme